MVRRSLENHDHSSTGNGGRQIKPDIVEVANSLGIPVESADADADNERLYFNSNDNTIKYKDSAGNVFSGAQGDVNNPMTANLDADGNNISNVGSLSTEDIGITPLDSGEVSLSAGSSVALDLSNEYETGYWTVVTQPVNGTGTYTVRWRPRGSGDPTPEIAETSGGGSVTVGWATIKLAD